MKIYYVKPTAGDASAVTDGKRKYRLLFPWVAALALAVCFFIVSGCAGGGASGGSAESTSEAAPGKWIPPDPVGFPLYPGIIPDSKPNSLEETSTGEGDSICYLNVTRPTLSVYLPQEDIATGAAVIICPGGGYSYVGYGSGTIVAEALAEHGIAAFVLKYRLPNDATMVDKTIGPLQDAQQAIKTVRQRAAEWGVDPDKVGIMGHSAGGHLAATAGTHFDHTFIPNEENIDLRPDFMILVSSVISMDEEITHMGSRINLLGENPDPEQVAYFSDELQVTQDTPPAWIAYAENDTTVPVENSELFFEALADFGVPAELEVYPTGGHGFVIDVSEDGWMSSLQTWLEDMGIIPST